MESVGVGRRERGRGKDGERERERKCVSASKGHLGRPGGMHPLFHVLFYDDAKL